MWLFLNEQFDLCWVQNTAKTTITRHVKTKVTEEAAAGYFREETTATSNTEFAIDRRGELLNGCGSLRTFEVSAGGFRC